MDKKSLFASIAVLLVLVVGVVVGLKWLFGPKPILDEALKACLLEEMAQGTAEEDALNLCRQGAFLQGSSDEYLRDMDRGWDKDQVYASLAEALDLPAAELEAHFSKDDIWDAYNKGRNNWMVWTGGNDRLWDRLTIDTFGTFDLLKTLSSHPSLKYCGNTENYQGYGSGNAAYYGPPQYPPGYHAYEYSVDEECEGKEDRKFYQASRDNRWKYFGLVNEPGFEKWDPADCEWANDKTSADAPYGKCGNPDRYGLWLDKRIGDPDPFESETAYPGVKYGARGKNIPQGSYYGYGSGIVGLRLLPNPEFDAEAEKNWDPVRYYGDPAYYNDPDLVRPYRVGMACGFCHVGPNPTNTPADYEAPKWENLASNPGAQYFWIDRIFYWNPKARQENFLYQLLHTSLPGSLDTSLVSSDNINNPRTMNAVYSLAARLDMAKHAKEKLTGGELGNRQFNDFERTSLLANLFQPPDTVFAPHVLKDGADSVGVLGALNRVYLNIGLASEEWLEHFMPLIGNLPLKRITPIEIAVLEQNSAYWNANIAQTPDLALFFLASAQPDRLKDAPGGAAFLSQDEETLQRGKIVFAETCARCHSGKQPEKLCRLGAACAPGDIVENSAGYFAWLRTEVQKPDFLEDNFLSTERRIAVTELGTNACSPLGTNGLGGDIWDNFTSTTYKELPAVGKLTVHHPKTGEPWDYDMPGDGRGYTRPASLISIWSTAPFLLNNAVGDFYGAGTVEARMASFDDSIRKMLWPERRKQDIDAIRELGLPESVAVEVPGYIQRTTATSSLAIPSAYLPDELRALRPLLNRWFPWIFGEGGIEIGPIPAGTAIGLLSNLPLVSDSTRLKDRRAHIKKVVRFAKKAIKDLKALPDGASDEQARRVFADLVDPLVELSKCPDYVVNRGHYFGSNLSDQDKLALIEFLKTF